MRRDAGDPDDPAYQNGSAFLPPKLRWKPTR